MWGVGNFTVFRCPSILHGRASERLLTDISKSLLFVFVRSKSLVIVGFAVRMGVDYGKTALAVVIVR
jgi:hypothetical protein